MRSDEQTMCCPYCHQASPCVFVGFGKDWLVCSRCQRRIRWSEVRTAQLIQEAGKKGESPARAYH